MKVRRLKQALTMASSHEKCTGTAIQRNETNTWGALEICETLLIFDIVENALCDTFRVHAPEWLPAPSSEAALTIANRANAKLAVAKVVVRGNSVGLFAHEFVPKRGIPSATNLERLIADVLIGVVLVLKELKSLSKESALLKELPACPEPSLN